VARNVAWGIDVGDSAVKATKIRKVGDSAVVQDFRTIPCESRGEDAQADQDYRIRSAIETLQQEVKLQGARIVVSMSGRDVFPRFIPLPPVEKKRIPEIVRYEARTQMPFPIEEVIWDYQPLTTDPAPGEEIEVGIFAIKRGTVYNFLNSLRLAKLMPDIVEISPLALYNYLMYDRSIDVGTVAIDIGSGTTDLVIIDGERFWTRNVSISGSDITRSLQEKYQISFEEAENLKRRASESKQAEKVFGAMRPILDDLIGEVQRSIGYYKAQTRNVRIEQVVLLGNAFRLRGLAEYFQANLDYEVSLLEGLQRVKAGGSTTFERELPNYAVSIGLALQGLGLGHVNIDMMPRDIVRERIVRAKVPYVAAGVALLAAPIFFGFQAADRQLTRVANEHAPVKREIAELEERSAELAKLRGLEPMQGQIAKLAEIGERRGEWLRFFDGLNKAMHEVRRGDFILRSVQEVEVVQEKKPPKGAAKKEEDKPRDLLIRLVFEISREHPDSDTGALVNTIAKQPHMQRVELLNVGDTSPGGGATELSDTMSYVTIDVTFNSEPVTDEE
jgi:type IV pilus assembly protein PilM